MQHVMSNFPCKGIKEPREYSSKEEKQFLAPNLLSEYTTLSLQFIVHGLSFNQGGSLLMKLGTILLALSVILPLSILYPNSLPSQVSLHEKIVLKGLDGSDLTLDSRIPYSPKKTCGACHEYDRITNGYHFQQGRTDGTGKIVISDTFDPKYPWNLSSGMYGKH